jgi:hypothetical protein
VFPNLQEALERMNAAQDRFGFQLVDTSAPAGSWRYARVDGSSRTLELDSYHAARKLRAKTAELGVDILICITNKLIFEDEYQGLYAWWWTDGDPADLPRNIAFFSAAIDNLPRTGAAANLVVANAAVTVLAALATGLDTHGVSGSRAEKEAMRRCPMYENLDLELKYIQEPQSFCPKCTDTLSSGKRVRRRNMALSSDAEALKILLDLFAPAGPRTPTAQERHHH